MPYSPLAANKQDDVDLVTGVDAGTTTNVGDHAQHHNDLATRMNVLTVGKTLNVKTDYGALGDTRQVEDGAMTSGTAILTSATAAFTAADVGKQISVMRATSTAFELYTEIEAFTNSTTVTVKLAPGFSLTGRTLLIGGGTRATDAVTTANSKTITSATAAFTAADVGRQVRIAGAGAVALSTTILSRQSATQVTLAASASNTTSAARIIWGTDDTDAFVEMLEDARDATSLGTSSVAYVPHGWYLVEPRTGETTAALIYSNTILKGEGAGSIIRMIGGFSPGGAAVAMLGVNLWNRGTSNPDDNEKDIVVQDLHLQGTTSEEGFYQWSHLLSMSAVSGVLIHNVKFSNWRGDAVYLGSGTETATIERHNRNVNIQTCLFDGINWDNRQSISIIDGEDITIERCTFWNCTRHDMPGAIDIEPNPANLFPIIRSIRIHNCYFRRVGGGTGVIGMAIFKTQTQLTTPMRGYLVTDCIFVDPLNNSPIYIQQWQYPTDAMIRNDISVRGCWMYNVNYQGIFDGVRGVEFDNNFIVKSSGALLLGSSQKVLDVSIINNTFIDIGTFSSYATELVNVERARFSNNWYEQVGLADTSAGQIFRFTTGSSLNVPDGVAVTAGAGSGATTYGYRVAAMRDNLHETLASSTVTIGSRPATLTGANYNRVSWNLDTAASGYRVYGRTSGSELLMATLGSGVSTWDDTGAVTPSGALPASNTSNWGNTRGIEFTNNIVRQGATNRTTRIADSSASHTTVDLDNVYANNDIPAGSLVITPFRSSTNALKPSVIVATTASVSLTPGGTTLTIDGVALANGDRVLVKNQGTVADNGVYVVSGIGSSVVLTRARDFDTRVGIADAVQIPVEQGTESSNTIWQLVTTNPVTVGTTALRFTRVYPAYLSVVRDPWDVGAGTAIATTMPRSTVDGQVSQSAITAISSFHGGLVLPAGRTITNINAYCTVAGSGAVTIHWYALVSVSGLLVLQRTANNTTLPSVSTSSTFYTRALQATYTPDVDTPAYVVWAMAVATTKPSFAGYGTGLAPQNLASPFLTGNSTTTPTSTPPTVGAALGAPSAGQVGRVYFWLT